MSTQAEQASHISDVRPEYIALGFLSYGQLHGYELYAQFQQKLGRVWRISQSQMYAIIKRLEAQGFIEAHRTETEPARRLLRATRAGLRRFMIWLKQPTDCNTRVLRLEFIARLYFARMQGPEFTASILREQTERMRRQLVNHERILCELDPEDLYNRLSFELRIQHLSAGLRWLNDNVSAALAAPLIPTAPSVPAQSPHQRGQTSKASLA